MEYRLLGKTGLKVSVLSFGNWLSTYTPEQEEIHSKIIKIAYDNGINFFDTAEAYGSGEGERQFGRIFKKHGWPRETLVISSKIFWNRTPIHPNSIGLQAKKVAESMNAMLERLQMDYVDIVFCHRPDDDTPMEETVRAMNKLIDDGKTFYWGTSDWSAAQIGEAFRVCDRLKLVKPVAEQVEYNMLRRNKVENEHRRYFEKGLLGTTLFSPLASGMLSGKYNDGSVAAGSRFDTSDPNMKWVWSKYWSKESTPNTIKMLTALAGVAKELGCTQAQLALAWTIVNRDTSTCILGATKIAQFEENLKALDVARKWTPELEKKIEGILGNAPDPELIWTIFPPTLEPLRRESSVRKID